MASLERDLIRPQENIALLFAPPFDSGPQDPGYIKGYPAGVRENGGQYTHAAAWSVMAFAALGQGDKAAALFWMLNPINHARTRADAHRYKVEPYATAADIYGGPHHPGRGGWSWYTGSAGVLFRAGLESILGVRIKGARLRIDPCIPATWPGFQLSLRIRDARFKVSVDNPDGVSSGVACAVFDGTGIGSGPADIPIEAGDHHIELTLGAIAPHTHPPAGA